MPTLREWCSVVVGYLLAAALAFGGLTVALWQRRALRDMADEPFLPDEDKRYRRGMARRRMGSAGLLVVIGGLIAGYYLSGMDSRMDAIPERNKDGQAEGDPQAEDDQRFARLVALYWSGILGLVFVVMCLAVVDFWASRRYWFARYKELKADHEAKLQRDLAVYRQQKLNARVPGLKPPAEGDDTPAGE